MTIKLLRELEKTLIDRENEYRSAMLLEEQDSYARNRYEGISTASRWAYEDLRRIYQTHLQVRKKQHKKTK
jgi:hypothetical protein